MTLSPLLHVVCVELDILHSARRRSSATTASRPHRCSCSSSSSSLLLLEMLVRAVVVIAFTWIAGIQVLCIVQGEVRVQVDHVVSVVGADITLEKRRGQE